MEETQAQSGYESKAGDDNEARGEGSDGQKKNLSGEIYKPTLLEQTSSRHRHTRGQFSKKSLQNHIEGSETDHIERGLQNQYQRWGYNPEMLYG